jgi:heme/copper-type cytochrome/quinol oxidase subunit 2
MSAASMTPTPSQVSIASPELLNAVAQVVVKSDTQKYWISMNIGIIVVVLMSLTIATYRAVATWNHTAGDKSDNNEVPAVATANLAISVILLLATLALIGFSIFKLSPAQREASAKNTTSKLLSNMRVNQ